LVRIRIWIQHFRLKCPKIKKNLQLKEKLKFFLSKTTIYLPWASIKDVQVTKEAFSSQKRTSSTSNMKFLKSATLIIMQYKLNIPKNNFVFPHQKL
jgi:hypothetical protein